MEEKINYSDIYISELVDKYSDMIIRLGFTYLKNIQDAEEVCQDVFIKIFEKRQKFVDHEHEKAWIIKVTINKCKDQLRSKWKKKIVLLNDIVLPIENNENREVVSSVLELPTKYRTVIYLYYFENYKTAEIAKLLNRKESTIRTQLKRAREILKNKMNGGFENER